MRMKITEERPSPSLAPTFGVQQPFDSRTKRHEALFNTTYVSIDIGDDDDVTRFLYKNILTKPWIILISPVVSPAQL